MLGKSYRESHSSKNCGKKYNNFYKRDYYDSRVWILEKEILERIIQKYFKKKINNYLDFACGTGRILEVFESKVRASYGIDVSEEMLNEARKKYLNTEFIKVDLTKYQKIIKKKFDVITAFRFFLNAEQALRIKALKAIQEILKDNGIFIFNIHCNKNSLIYFFKENSKINTLTLTEMYMLLKKYNFKINDIYGLGYLPWYFSVYFSKKLWVIIERIIMKLKLFKKFGSNLILVCCKD